MSSSQGSITAASSNYDKNLQLQEFAFKNGKIDQMYRRLLKAVAEVEAGATFVNMSRAMELMSSLSLFVLTYPHDYPEKATYQTLVERTRKALGYGLPVVTQQK